MASYGTIVPNPFWFSVGNKFKVGTGVGGGEGGGVDLCDR